jgi:hypothetical protein
MSWSAVLASPYNSDTTSVFAIGTGLRKRIEGEYSYEWGLDAPDNVPTIAAGSLTGLTGSYNAKYSYARKERAAVVCESNLSDAATSAATLSNQSLRITVTAPDDGQVNNFRFYRTTAGGTVYYYSGELNYCNRQYAVTQDWEETDQYISGVAYRFTTEDERHSTENCYTWELLYSSYTITDNVNRITGIADNELFIDDNTADASLGTAAHSDHNRPPENGAYIFGPTANGTIFLLKDSKTYYCKPQQPEYWPSTYYVEVSSQQYPLVCGTFYDTRPYLFDRRNIYYLAGLQFVDLPGLTSFRPLPQESKAGAFSAAGVKSVLGLGIFHIGYDGVYRFAPTGDNGIDEKVTEQIDPIFKGTTLGGIPAVGDLTYAWLEWYQDKLYFGYPSGSDTYPKNVIVFDFFKKKIKYYVYPNDMAAICNDKYYNRLLVCPSTGNLNKIEDVDATDDIGTVIDWEVESKEFVLQTRLHYPRWNKYDVDASSATSAYGYTYLEDALVQTHSITENRNTRRRLIDLSNGNRFSIRLSGTGPIEIYAVESE